MTAYQIINIREHPELAPQAANWFHDKWGVPLTAYEDSIAACLEGKAPIPQWYLALTPDGTIIGGLGAIENDFHCRKDLTPNVCAVYTEEDWRGQGISRSLLNHVCADLAGFGIVDVYLLTDHTEFYERCGWQFLCMAEEDGGGQARVYHRRCGGAETERFDSMPDGREIRKITLRSGEMCCSVLTYGGTLQSLKVGDVDVVLGFDDLAGYQGQTNYIGALVGRYANRIAYGKFTLNDVEYSLAANDGDHHLHGGNIGFDKRLWTVEDLAADRLTLSLFSPDGEEGYPGNLAVRVTYKLAENSLTIDYEAVSDADTLCNLTNHAYFNLSGHNGTPVTEQELQIFGDFYTPTDAGLVPLGKPEPVEGTPMDLRRPLKIGDGMHRDFEQLKQALGYDHNWVLNGETGSLRSAAKAFCPETGLAMEVETTLPGLQLFVSRFPAPGLKGKGDTPYIGRQGFCLETQFYPDSPNHPDYPQAVLRAGESWRHTTVFRFSE